MPDTNDVMTVTCPYCGEVVEIYLEPDVMGMLIQDCEVCCNPWQHSASTATATPGGSRSLARMGLNRALRTAG